jgi:hypothetical protein
MLPGHNLAAIVQPFIVFQERESIYGGGGAAVRPHGMRALKRTKCALASQICLGATHENSSISGSHFLRSRVHG